MSLITSLTRTWLTRTTRPFTFKNEYDKHLDYVHLDNLGLYIHIPFCVKPCDFCPYCKVPFNQEQCDNYTKALIKEIHMVGKQSHTKKDITSLYFGGGTPTLALEYLKDILDAVNDHFIIHDGIGIELHPHNVNFQTLITLKELGITKISIGIQSFNTKYQSILGRQSIDIDKLYEELRKVHFETVSMDFIFALPHQTYDDLKEDIDLAFTHGANHVAIYPFIDFAFTSSTVKTMEKKEKRKLLDQITNYCLDKGYYRSSIWTFSNDKNAKYSSMTRDNFLGFGVSSTTLLKDQFKINTFSIDEYIKRINNECLPTSLTIRFTLHQRMVYYLFWSAYSTRVDERDFEKFFKVPLSKEYGFELWLAGMLGYVTKHNGIYEMTLKGAFYYHYYENFYTLSYIDKMWGILKDEAFPSRIEL